MTRDAPWLTPPVRDKDASPKSASYPRNGIVRSADFLLGGGYLVHLVQLPKSTTGLSGGRHYLDFYTSQGIWLTTVPVEELGENDAWAVWVTVAHDGAIWIAYYGYHFYLVRYEFKFLNDGRH